MKTKLQGNIDIFVAQNEEEFNGKTSTWNEIFIHGDPQGLKSLGQLLIDLANIDQDKIDNSTLPVGAREHLHLIPGKNISKSSDNVIIGRLDAKGTGDFYERFIP